MINYTENGSLPSAMTSATIENSGMDFVVRERQRLHSLSFEELLKELNTWVYYCHCLGRLCYSWSDWLRLKAVQNELADRELTTEQEEAVEQIYRSIPQWSEDLMKAQDDWLQNYRERCENGILEELVHLFAEVRNLPDPVWLSVLQEVLERRFPKPRLTLDDLQEALKALVNPDDRQWKELSARFEVDRRAGSETLAESDVEKAGVS